MLPSAVIAAPHSQEREAPLASKRGAAPKRKGIAAG